MCETRDASTEMTEDENSLILIDTHVHFHPNFAIEVVLSQASQNFAKHAAQSNSLNSYHGCLLLTEMAGEDWFLRHHDAVLQQNGILSMYESWSLESTLEDVSLMAVHPSRGRLSILAGRQVVTQEKLEVLALLTRQIIPDGLPLRETIDQITNAGGMPILPWGFGKWFGRRGQIVQDFLQQERSLKVLVGDNGNRPVGWHRPHIFRVAEQRGLPVLPGSDPLPLPSEVSRIASYGLKAMGRYDPKHPGRTVRDLLNSLAPPITAFGGLNNPWHFCKSQLFLRLRSKSLEVRDRALFSL